MEHTSDFGMIDFMDEANFEQFIELVRGETEEPIVNFCPYYDGEHITGCLVDDIHDLQFAPPAIGHQDHHFLGYDATSVPELDSAILNSLYGEVTKGEDENDGHESSGTTTTTTTTSGPMKKSSKADRSRALVSERRRRGSMKEELYALRSLVPNITKMDKASIVGDAAMYVQELQMQAKKLKAEIAALEASSLPRVNKYEGASCDNPNKLKLPNYPQTFKKILQMDVFQVEERGFYVKIICNKGQGVAVLLYQALESLTSFVVQNSNLATASEIFVLTFTLRVREHEMDMILPSNMKLLIAGALANKGFEF